jgi:[ribosomal protein S5]-alanine N-acetyltransferase
MPFQDIKTKRLVIREYSDMYLEQVFEFRSDQSIYSSYTKKQNTKDELKAYLNENITEFNKQDGYSVLLILLGEKVIGEIAIMYWDHNNEKNEIGYAIGPMYRRNGYAYEAISEIIKYMFEMLKRNRIQASTDYDNKASRRLLKKLGFIEEGHFRQTEYKDVVWKDSCSYAFLREDYEKHNA